MRTALHDFARVPHAGDVLARLIRTIDAGGAGPARQDRRAHRALQVDGSLVADRSEIAQTEGNLLPGLRGVERLPPSLQLHGVHVIDERALWRPGAGTRTGNRAEQFGPALLDDPADGGVGKRSAQHGSRRQGMNHVAERTKAHDEDAIEVVAWR